MRLMILRQYEDANGQNCRDRQRQARGGQAAGIHPGRQRQRRGIGCVAFGMGEEVIEVKAEAVAHGAGFRRLQDVEVIIVVPGRKGIHQHQPGRDRPVRQPRADMRRDRTSHAQKQKSGREVGDLEIVERDQHGDGIDQVEPVIADRMTRRHEEDERQDGEQAPAVAVVGHRERVGVRLVADIGRHQGQQAGEHHEQDGRPERQTPHRRERCAEKNAGGDHDRAGDNGEGRGPQQRKAKPGELEVQRAQRLAEVDMEDVPVLQVPGAGDIVEEVPRHLVRQHEVGRQQQPGAGQHRQARQQHQGGWRRTTARALTGGAIAFRKCHFPQLT